LGKLSAAARGEVDAPDDPENVVSDLQGHVAVKDGTATFRDLSFNIPGAKARLHGTFNLINQTVDLRGTLFMHAQLHQATSGIKSFLLKAIDPFLKKNRRGGAVILVSITGTYQHPSYNADPI
jgi:AsmA-like C-terminal region